ncbi:AAA family ATPase [Burkholderia cepacia]|nr:AAA family ATPase [Burkholderia cepacia]
MPQLLADIPAGKNAIQGPHHRIAKAIATLIRNCKGGQSIRLDGDWGVGKSTIVRLLAKEFEAQPAQADELDVVVFEYDAWVHAGDPLRRAFFEALIAQLRGRWLPTLRSPDDHDEWTDRIEFLAKRLKKSSRQSEPVFRDNDQTLITLLLCAGLVSPLLNSAISSLAQGKGFFASIAWAAVLGWGAYKILRPLTGRTLGLILRRQPDSENVTVTDAGEPTSLDFQNAFFALLDTVLGGRTHATANRRLVIVVDNLDRVDEGEVRATWALLRSFLDNPTFRAEPWYERVWLLVPMARPEKVNPGSTDSPKDVDNALEKVFQVQFAVPDMTTHFWRSFFEDRMARAFEKLNRKSRDTVIDLYAEEHPRTPRAIVRYINSLVALYVERGLREEDEGVDKNAIGIEVLAAYQLWEQSPAAGGALPEIAPYMIKLTGRNDLQSMFDIIRLGAPDRRHVAYIYAQQQLEETFSGPLDDDALNQRIRRIEAFIEGTYAADRDLKRFALQQCSAFPGPLAAFAQTAKTFIDQKRSSDASVNQVFVEILATLEQNGIHAVQAFDALPLTDLTAIDSIVTTLSSLPHPDGIAREICRKLDAESAVSIRNSSSGIADGIARLLRSHAIADAILAHPTPINLHIDADSFTWLAQKLNGIGDRREVLQNCTCSGGDRELVRFLKNTANRPGWDRDAKYVLHLLGMRNADAFDDVCGSVTEFVKNASNEYSVVTPAIALLVSLVRTNPELAKPRIRALAESGSLTKFIALSVSQSRDEGDRFAAVWLVLWSWTDHIANGSFANDADNHGLQLIREWLTAPGSLGDSDIASMCDALVDLMVFDTLNALSGYAAFVRRILNGLPSTVMYEYRCFDHEGPLEDQAERFAASWFPDTTLQRDFLESYARYRLEKSRDRGEVEDSEQVG